MMQTRQAVRFSSKHVFLSVMLAAFLLATLALPASAHMFMAYPDATSASAGASLKVLGTLSEPFPQPDLSGYRQNASIAGYVVNPDGTRSAMPSFVFYDSATGKSYTKAALDAVGSADVADAMVDSQMSTAAIATSGATSVIAATMDMTAGTSHYICYTKSFVNLTADGASAKTFGGNAVMEIVPVTDLGSDTIVPGASTQFRLLLKGSPVANATVNVSFNGCKDYTIDPDQPIMAQATTNASGIATLALPSTATDCYIFAQAADPAVSGDVYRASLLFRLEAGNAGESEVDITDDVIASGRNAGNVGFLADKSAATQQFLLSENLIWADERITTPTGTTSIHTGESEQIAGNSGFAFNVPMDRSGSRQGTVGFETVFTFTPVNIGADTYAAMAAEIKSLPSQQVAAGSYTYFIPADPAFLKKFGISIKARFENGETRDVTTMFSYGLLIDDMDAGSMPMSFGSIYVDSDPVNGSLSKKLDIVGDVPYIFYDGKSDNAITGTFWLTQSANSGGGSSSSSCNAGVSLALALAALAPFVWKRRKR